MAEERVALIKIEVDQDQALTALDQTTKRLEILRKEREQLTRTFKRGGITINEFSKQLNQNRLASDRLRKTQRGLIKDLNTENKSLQALRNNVAKLTSQRNQQEVSTKRGRLEFNRLNKSIKEQNVSIKEAEEAGGDFRRSVGNYEKGISDTIPVFGSSISRIKDLTKASLAFIATPLGAILATIALVLGAVSQAFSRTVEGGDELAEIMGVVSGTFQAVLDIISALGRLIIDSVVGSFKVAGAQISVLALGIEKQVLQIRIAFNNLTGDTEEAARLTAELAETDAELAKQTAILVAESEDQLNTLNKNTGALLDNIAATGTKINQTRLLAIAERELEKATIANIADSARRRKEIARLRLIARDEAKATRERSQALRDAINVEKGALATETILAKNRLENARTANRINDSTLDDIKELAEAEANLLDVESRSLNRRRELVQQLNELNRRIAAENTKRLRDREKAAKEEADREAKAQKELDDLINKEIKARQKLEIFRLQQDIKLSQSTEERIAAENALAVARRDNATESISADLAVLESKQQLNEQENLQLQTLKNTELLIEETFQAELTRIETEGEKARADELEQQQTRQREQLEKTAAIQQQLIQATLGAFSATAGAIDGFIKATGGKFKGFAIVQATIDTFAAINRVLADPTPIPFFVRAINAAAVGIQGLSNVSKIKNQQFHSGGVLAGPSHADGGIPFAVGGRLGFEAEGGEAIMSKKATTMFAPQLSAMNVAGGGRAFQDGGIPKFQDAGLTGASFLRNQEANLNNLDSTINGVLNNLPQMFVSVTEIDDVQRGVAVSEQDATI